MLLFFFNITYLKNAKITKGISSVKKILLVMSRMALGKQAQPKTSLADSSTLSLP